MALPTCQFQTPEVNRKRFWSGSALRSVTKLKEIEFVGWRLTWKLDFKVWSFLDFCFFLSVYWCGFVYSLMFQYSVWVSLRFGIKLSFLRCESISRDFSERKHTDNIQTTNIQTYWTTCHNRILFACCNIMLTLYCFESAVWKIGFGYCIVCKYVLLYRMRTIHWNRWCSNARQDWNRLE